MLLSLVLSAFAAEDALVIQFGTATGPGGPVEVPDVAGACTSPVTPLPTMEMPAVISLKVEIRRGKVRLVTAQGVAPGAEWVAGCLERELASATWTVRKGTVVVPAEIRFLPPSPPPEPNVVEKPAPEVE